ncbi:MAG: hypothetical protein Q7R48_01645 [bacterium]|nr:hypothetical protein [bacterium]
MNIKKIAVSAAPAILFLGMAALAFAQTPGGTTGGGYTAPTGPTTLGGLIDITVLITNLVFTALVVFAIIYIILAGFQFVTAGGDPAAVLQARSKLIYASIGIIVALLARAIPTVLRQALGL